MTRGDYEFQQYCQALKDAVTLGMALTKEEQEILDQGIICGAVKGFEERRWQAYEQEEQLPDCKGLCPRF